MRNLKKQLEKIYRKVALRIVKDGQVSAWPVQAAQPQEQQAKQQQQLQEQQQQQPKQQQEGVESEGGKEGGEGGSGSSSSEGGSEPGGVAKEGEGAPSDKVGAWHGWLYGTVLLGNVLSPPLADACTAGAHLRKHGRPHLVFLRLVPPASPTTLHVPLQHCLPARSLTRLP